MKKNILCFLVVLMLVLPITGVMAAEYPSKLDNISYNVMIRVRPLNGDTDEMQVFSLMEDATNVHLEFQSIPQAEWKEKINLLLAVGVDLPDALYSAYALTGTELVTYGSQGILIPLNEYIDTYMPNFQRVLVEHPEVKAAITAPDGNIYSLPFIRYDGLTGQIPSNMFINQAWLDRLGLEIPTTIEELETVLTAFKEQDANGNGDSSDEIPMSFKFLGSQRDLGGCLACLDMRILYT